MATNRFQYSKESKNNDWHCVVHQEPWTDQVKVYLMYVKDGIRKVAHCKDGIVELSDYKENSADNQPFLILPYMGWQTLLECLGGITPDQIEIETGSELRATKYHLEDLRTLLKMK